MIRAVIFDLDHTLFDRHATLRALVPFLRERFSVNDAMTDSAVGDLWIYADDRFVYSGWKYIFAYLVENGVFTEPPEYADYRTFIFESFARIAVPFPDTLPMLTELKEKGYKIALITNGQHALQYKKLELTGLRYVFDEIIISGDVGVEKPDPEIFLMMLDKLALAPQEAVYVGDNPINDILGAHRAGMKTLWIKSTGVWNPKAPSPGATANAVADIPAAIDRIS